MSFVILNCGSITRKPVLRSAANDNLGKADDK